MSDQARSRRGVVLLSGGLDSATVLALARAEGWSCYALTVAYGQRHQHELDCAARLARALGAVEHRVMRVDLGSFGGSSLVGDGAVPKDGAGAASQAIPSTYVPARNTVFLSLALAWAEVVEADAIHLGINAVDYSGYPDCRPEYLEAFRRLSGLATRRGVEGNPVRILAPLLAWSKGEIIRRGTALGLDYGLTSSCYDPGEGGAPCRRCDSCRLRARGFEEAGLADPLLHPPGCGSWEAAGGPGRAEGD